MRLTFLAVDRLREPSIRQGCQLYVTRLAPYFAVEMVEVRPATGPDRLEREGDALLRRVPDGARVWALDRQGVEMTSLELAGRVAAIERSGNGHLVVAVGGADGLDGRLLQRAELSWSLSRLTFLHEMSRLIALEQLYRTARINRRQPYHR